MNNSYSTHHVIYNKLDNKNRSVSYLDSKGWGYERIFDDNWHKDIPAEVIEYQHGVIIYERHYDDVVIDKAKGIGC